MQISYSLGRRDIFFARFIFMFRNKVMLVLSLLPLCLFAFALSTGDEVRKHGAGARILMAFFGFWFSAFLYLAILLVLNLIHTYSSKLTGVIGSHTLEIKDDGLEESTSVNKSLHRWNAAFRVKEFGNYIWIYTTDTQIFMIPKRKGGFEGDLDGFLSQLKAKMGQGTVAPKGPPLQG